MQQTESYNLKLIETGDPFDPEALNENARTLEAQLARVAAAAAAESARVDAALVAKAAQADLATETAARTAEDARLNSALAAKAAQTALTAEEASRKSEIARLEGALLKFDCGTYTGNGAKGRKISLSFTPRMVYVGYDMNGVIYGSNGYHRGGVALKGIKAGNTNYTTIEIVENGFLVSEAYNNGSYIYSANSANTEYRWFAIG